MKKSYDELKRIALEMRKRILRTAWRANGGHIAPAYSMVEIVTLLYFGGYLKYKAKDPLWNDRDYFILSKGHGAIALYSALGMAGFFDINELDGFCKPGSHFGSLAKKGGVPGVEASTGSLGHGLSYAVGIALANKIDKKENQTFVLLGDGECEEGSIWEGLMSAVHYKLDNLTIIVDNNSLQAMGDIEGILSFGNIAGRGRAFGLTAVDVDGHDFAELEHALATEHRGRPLLVVAHTIKGKGISFMENVPIWHYRVPDEKEIETAIKELGMTKEELGTHENCLFRNII